MTTVYARGGIRESNVGLDCGTSTGWSRGCRCVACKLAHRAYMANWREIKRDHKRQQAAVEAQRKRARLAALAGAVCAAVGNRPLPAPRAWQGAEIAREPLLAAVRQTKGFRVSLTREDVMGQRRG